MTLALYGKSKTRRAALLGGALLAVVVATVGALGFATLAFAHTISKTVVTPTCSNQAWSVKVVSDNNFGSDWWEVTISTAGSPTVTVPYTPFLVQGGKTLVDISGTGSVTSSGTVNLYAGGFGNGHDPDVNGGNNALAIGDVTLESDDDWPAEYVAGNVIRWGSELMLITARSADGNTLTVTRGFAGTTEASHTDVSNTDDVTLWSRNDNNADDTESWNLNFNADDCNNGKIQFHKYEPKTNGNVPWKNVAQPAFTFDVHTGSAGGTIIATGTQLGQPLTGIFKGDVWITEQSPNIYGFYVPDEGPDSGNDKCNTRTTSSTPPLLTGSSLHVTPEMWQTKGDQTGILHICAYNQQLSIDKDITSGSSSSDFYWNIKVKNPFASDQNVIITDTGATLVSGPNASDGSCTGTTDTFTCTVKAGHTITIKVSKPKPTATCQDQDVGNTASVALAASPNTIIDTADGGSQTVHAIDCKDLTVTKLDDASGSYGPNGSYTLPGSFHWKVQVRNVGNERVTFGYSEYLLRDNLPTNNGLAYSNLQRVNQGMDSGEFNDFTCTLTNGSAAKIECQADSNHHVDIDPGDGFDAIVTATPTSPGTYANPRSGEGLVCRVDPDGKITETNEANNNCSDTVTGLEPAGTLRIVKNDTVHAADRGSNTDGDWDFTISKGGNPFDTASSAAAEGSTTTAYDKVVAAGQYLVTELDAVTTACTSQGAKTYETHVGTIGDPIAGSKLADVTAGGITTVTFTNEDCGRVAGTAKVTVTKVIDYNGDGAFSGGIDEFADGWHIKVDCGPGNVFEKDTGGSNHWAFFDGMPNNTTCTISETPQGGYNPTGWQSMDTGTGPDNGAGTTTTMHMDDGDNNKVSFYNQPLVNIHVHKDVITNAGKQNAAGWKFTLSGCGVPSQDKTTPADGDIDFMGLPAAVGCTYTVTETEQAGWTVSPSGSQTAAPTAPGSTASLTFTNTYFTTCGTECVPRQPETPVVPPPPPPSPSPEVTRVAGERTAGPAIESTPIAPSTGTGTTGGGTPATIVLALAGVAMAGSAFTISILARKPRR